jgi:hypothetical protein
MRQGLAVEKSWRYLNPDYSLALNPFALSLSKGRSWFDAPQEIPLGDKLTTNGLLPQISPNR